MIEDPNRRVSKSSTVMVEVPIEMLNAPPGWRMSGGHIPGVPLKLR